jgi:VTC domain
VTHFPHAVLEVKLSLAQGQSAQEWVTELTDGRARLGFEVHKFSKFIHGTAVLYPQCVQVRRLRCCGSSAMRALMTRAASCPRLLSPPAAKHAPPCA